MAYQSSCYWFNSDAKTWSDANLDCQAQGGHLVVINDRYVFTLCTVCYLLVEPQSGEWIHCFNLPVPLACVETYVCIIEAVFNSLCTTMRTYLGSRFRLSLQMAKNMQRANRLVIFQWSNSIWCCVHIQILPDWLCWSHMTRYSYGYCKSEYLWEYSAATEYMVAPVTVAS